MDIPEKPYVALYGTFFGDWRQQAKTKLDAHHITWYDSTDPGWDGINDANGDEKQPEINALVRKEHLGLSKARCVIFYLARREIRHGQPTGATTMSLAARCELGFLAGRNIRTFVHIEPDVVGRNYLWALLAVYSATMTHCATLEEAVDRAIEFMR